MKNGSMGVIVGLVLMLMSLAGVAVAQGEERPDFSKPETLQKILGDALLWDTLEKRGPEGAKLFYAPDSKTPYTGWAKTRHLNEKVRRLGHHKDGKLEGLATLWHDNGQKAGESTFKAGKQEGLDTLWHGNGEKAQEGTYKDGEMEGVWTGWHENGQKKQEGTYKDGRQEGPYATWHENGEKKQERTYKDGKQEGLEILWHENGEKKQEGTYKGGKLEGLVTVWHDNGQKEQEGTNKDGKLEGLVTQWHDNGMKAGEVTYKDGEREGSYTNWHDNGQKSEEGTYKDRKQEGLATAWDENGVVVLQAHFKNGKQFYPNEPDLDDPKILEEIVGKAVKWDTLKQEGRLYHVAGNPEPYTGWIKKFHDNGKVAALGMLKGGEPDGLWTLWDEDGQKEEETRYMNGVRVAN